MQMCRPRGCQAGGRLPLFTHSLCHCVILREIRVVINSPSTPLTSTVSQLGYSYHLTKCFQSGPPFPPPPTPIPHPTSPSHSPPRPCPLVTQATATDQTIHSFLKPQTQQELYYQLKNKQIDFNLRCCFFTRKQMGLP